MPSGLEPLIPFRGPSFVLLGFLYLSASSVLEPGTRQLGTFSRYLARAAEVSSAVLPTLVPARTAVLTSGGRIRCGCGRCLCALRWGRWGHLPVLPGGSTPAAFAALLRRALLGSFTEGRKGPLSVFRRFFLPFGLFPACFLVRLYFIWAGWGGTQLGIPLQFLSQKVATLQCCLFGQKRVLSLMRTAFDRVQFLMASYPDVHTLHG